LDDDGHILNNVRTSRQAAIWLNCAAAMMMILVESPQDRIKLKDALTELLEVKYVLIRGMDGLSFSNYQKFELHVI